MNKKTNAPEIPLCTNIIRLQSYLLAPDEVILFDWFVVKQVSFKFNEFHYSQARIEEETRIKRTRQNVIINKFKEMGFLFSQVRENKETRGRVNYFKVNFDILADKDVLSEIISEKDFMSALKIINDKGLLPDTKLPNEFGWKKEYYIDYVLKLVSKRDEIGNRLRENMRRYVFEE